MRIFVITKRTLIIWILILALVITGIILLLSFTPNAAAVSSSAMVEAYEMEVLAAGTRRCRSTAWTGQTRKSP